VTDDNSRLLQTVQAHIFMLGQFWHAFNSLELHLRLYLCGAAGIRGAERVAELARNEGETAPLNPMTDYRSFGELCKAFNDSQAADKRIGFDEYIKMRDALAHGRVTGDEHGRMTVIKYSKGKAGVVKVEFKRELSHANFEKVIEEMNWLGMEVSRRNGAVMPPNFEPNKFA
jgi:hypothetical protein